MFQRGFSPAMILETLRSGEIIASYSDDIPYPSHLLLRHAHGNPLHVVVAQDPATDACYIITVYNPDLRFWEPDYKTRRKP